jgi:phage terminase Nu1 subunit (DNA packaging protein)
VIAKLLVVPHITRQDFKRLVTADLTHLGTHINSPLGADPARGELQDR